MSSKQTGSNGQSTLCMLLSAAFGEYFLNGHPAIITGKIEKAQSANAAVYELKGRCPRVETDDDTSTTKVNMAKLKSYSGNDVSITARTLYKTQEQFKPTFQIIICMNRLPTLSTIDGGTRRRVRNIPFESKFVENPNDKCWGNFGNVFPINRELKQKIPFMGASLMRVLLERYQIYYNSCLVVPRKITVASEEFIEQHNDDINFIIRSTITPRLKFTDNKRDYVQFVFIKKWIQDRNFKSISTNALYDALEEIFPDNYNPSYHDYANKKDYSK